MGIVEAGPKSNDKCPYRREVVWGGGFVYRGREPGGCRDKMPHCWLGRWRKAPGAKESWNAVLETGGGQAREPVLC